MKKGSTKKALFCSLMVMVLCVTMLMGTTLAWFTDTAVSENNVIKTGTLDVKMYWTDTLAGEETEWKNVEGPNAEPIFNYDRWEPGYAEVRYIKIENNGSLAFKYLLNVIPNAEETLLAEVIDVYYAENVTENIDNRSLSGLTKTDKTVQDLMRDDLYIGEGNLLAGKDIVIAIGLKMQETAGNEYQNQTLGEDFTIKLFATQYTYEEDSFDDQYDKDATFPRVYYKINTDKDLVIDEEGKYIVLNDSERNTLSSQSGQTITLKNATFTGSTEAFDLGTYRNASYNNYNTVLTNVNILNVTVTNGVGNRYDKMSPVVYGYGKTEFNNCVIKGAKNTADGYTAYDIGVPNKSVCTINGGEYGSIYMWSHAKATINNAKVDRIDSAANKEGKTGKLVIGSGTTVGVINLTDPDFTPVLTIEEGATVGKIVYKGVEYTVEEWNNR